MLPASMKKNYLVQFIKIFYNLLDYSDVKLKHFLSSSLLHVYKVGTQLFYYISGP
jgi:hypothetical protein